MEKIIECLICGEMISYNGMTLHNKKHEKQLKNLINSKRYGEILKEKQKRYLEAIKIASMIKRVNKIDCHNCINSLYCFNSIPDFEKFSPCDAFRFMEND